MSTWTIGGQWDPSWENQYDEPDPGHNDSRFAPDIGEEDDYDPAPKIIVKSQPRPDYPSPGIYYPLPIENYDMPQPVLDGTSKSFLEWPWETPAGEGFNLNWGALFGNKESGFGSSLTTGSLGILLPLLLLGGSLKKNLPLIIMMMMMKGKG